MSPRDFEPSLQNPLSAEISVSCARDFYLAENGFTVDEYDAKWTKASFFFLRLAVPNTHAHKIAIQLHDLHHVATGYGTDLIGEGEISAWEIGAGIRGCGLYVAGIIASGALIGAILAPSRTLAA